MNICKKCISTQRKEHYQRNKEQIKEYHVEYYQENKKRLHEHNKLNWQDPIKKKKNQNRVKEWKLKNPEYKKQKDAEYYQNNKEEISKNTKQYYEDNKNHLSLKSKEWRKNNKERCFINSKITKARRRSRSINLKENFTANKIRIVFLVFNYQCFNCDSKNNLCLDHFKPLSKGNTLSFNNVIILCNRCNSSKHTKDPQDFFLSHKFNRAKSLMRDAQRVYDKVA